MAFDREGFQEWLSGLAPTTTAYTAAAYRAFSLYLTAIEKEYGTDLAGMSAEQADLVEDLLTQAVLAAHAGNTPLRGRYQRASDTRAAYRAYRRYQQALQTLPEPTAARALPQHSNIILGALRGKMYLAPDAFPPEDYPLPQPHAA